MDALYLLGFDNRTHFVMFRLVGPVTVVLGAHYIREEEPTQVRLQSSGIVIHPEWSRLLLRNDIALVRLSREVEFSRKGIHLSSFIDLQIVSFCFTTTS